MVKSCVNRFGADLNVPSIIQCSASDMEEVFVGVPHRKDLLVWAEYPESQSIRHSLLLERM